MVSPLSEPLMLWRKARRSIESKNEKCEKEKENPAEAGQ
jgi:hypothetical protein